MFVPAVCVITYPVFVPAVSRFDSGLSSVSHFVSYVVSDRVGPRPKSDRSILTEICYCKYDN